eukprot:scaffold154272_cov32-Tisochrysis_lutea.AAC.2
MPPHLHSEGSLAYGSYAGDSSAQCAHRDDNDTREPCQPVDIVDTRFGAVLGKIDGRRVRELPSSQRWVSTGVG